MCSHVFYHIGWDAEIVFQLLRRVAAVQSAQHRFHQGAAGGKGRTAASVAGVYDYAFPVQPYL